MEHKKFWEKFNGDAMRYELENKVKLARISDWNTTIQDISLPLGMYGESFGRSLGSLTRYPETETTTALCEELLAAIRGQAIGLEAMHLYGSATQAINMLFFALKSKPEKYKGNKFIFLSPGYYSVQVSAKAHGFEQETVCRLSKDGFKIDLGKIIGLLKSGTFCAVVITEPVYSAGVRQSGDDLRLLVEYCDEENLLLIIDGSFSGLVWNGAAHWQDKELLSLLKYSHVILVDSISKKLFFHNTKIGVLYGPKWLIDSAREGADDITGNITAFQQELARSIFCGNYEKDLAKICDDNITKFKARFSELEQICIHDGARNYTPRRPDSGYHAMVFRSDFTLGRVDVYEWNRRLNEKGVFTIPGHDFGYGSDDFFCFRVSLSVTHEKERLETALLEDIPLKH